jgi:hypothetical protein
VEFDFSQNTSVADINKIPNDFRGLYKQVEDKFVLDNEHPGVKSAISAVTGLNTALKAARLEAKNRPTGVDLTLLKEYGETPEAIHTKISEVIDGLKTQIKGVNIDKIKQDLAKEFSDKLTGAETKATSLENQLFDTLVVGSASSAIAAAKGDVELLMPFIRTQVKTTVANGKYNVNVVDAAGDIRSVTLAESAKLAQNQLVAGVIETVITVNRMFEVMPFDGDRGQRPRLQPRERAR